MPAAKLSAAFAASVVLLCGAASAAIDWGEQYQSDTGPACWINPVEGRTMAWTVGEGHFQRTAGGPVLVRRIDFKAGQDDLFDRTIEADRIIRAAATGDKIKIGPSTALLIEMKANAPADYTYQILVAVPVMPGEAKSPQAAWGVKRIDFPSTTVAHMRYEGPVKDLNASLAKVNDFLVEAVKSPDAANVDYGLFSVVEFYNLEEDAKEASTIFEVCTQVKLG